MLKNAELVTCAALEKQLPDPLLPEWILVGRSNVGKSSLLNTLTNRRRLAYISSKPGKTQMINFYHVDKKICLVDTPGYGFARVGHQMRDKWAHLMGSYLNKRRMQKQSLDTEEEQKVRYGILQIIDFRHNPLRTDIEAHQFLLSQECPIIIIGTKADCVSKTHWAHKIKVLKQQMCMKRGGMVLPFSSKTKLGLKELQQLCLDI